MLTSFIVATLAVIRVIDCNDLSDFVISPTEVSAFKYADQVVRIWSSFGNVKNTIPTSQWQFRYDPIFVPQVSKNGSIMITTEKFGNKEWRTWFTILLDDDTAKKSAFENVKNSYPNETGILLTNIFALPVSSLTIKSPDILEAVSGVKFITRQPCPLMSACFEFHAPSQSFRVIFSSRSLDAAKLIQKMIPNSQIFFEMQTVGSRQKATNSASLTFKQLKRSQLYIRLKGEGGKNFVSREDLRKLILDSRKDIIVDAVIEDPDRFDSGLIRELCSRWKMTSTEKFDEASWASTYNQKDLMPDTINHELKKIFIYDESKKQYRVSVDGQGSFLGRFAVGATYSREELSSLLRKLDIHFEFSGSKIIAKSIDVVQVNWNDFEDSSSVATVYTYVSNVLKIQPIAGFLDLSRQVPSSLDLTEQSQKVQEQSQASLKSVEALQGDLQDALKKIETRLITLENESRIEDPDLKDAMTKLEQRLFTLEYVSGCENPWILACHPKGCYCYRYTPLRFDWFTARQHCQNNKADLTSITCHEELKIVKNLKISMDHDIIGLWIGLNDIDQENKFKWVDGTPLGYTAWRSGEPNNKGGNEDCVNLSPILMNDDNCQGRFPSVCRKPVGPTDAPNLMSKEKYAGIG